jgi:phosphoribosylformylglycinamidine cyclo-ligase
VELYEVFNMGCGFCVVVPRDDAEDALELLGRHHPGSALIGQTTTATGVVELPKQGLIGRRGEGFRQA